MPTTTVPFTQDAIDLLGATEVTQAPKAAPAPASAPKQGLDPATAAEIAADSTAVAKLAASSVPAAFDREHLYSPSADVVAYGIDYRPGGQFDPLPAAPRGNSKAWGEWWRTQALTETPDYLGLRVGDDITIQHVTSFGPGTVVSTCRFGAVVRYPMPCGADKPYEEMYVRSRNHFGHWYR